MDEEKSDNVDEEGWCKGPGHGDIGFDDFVHFPLYFGILHLDIVIEIGLVSTLFLHGEESPIS